MARLIGIGLAALALVKAAPGKATGSSQWEPLIAAAAIRYRVPPAWIVRVMDAESRGRTVDHGHPIRSRVGAMGLMQLMPATWREMRSRYRFGDHPDDPHDNIMAGAAYLRLMYDRFGYPGLFAAYNAGPARYDAYLRAKATLPAETFLYLATVVGSGSPSRRAVSRQLFALRAGLVVTAGEPASTDPLFVVRAPRQRGAE